MPTSIARTAGYVAIVALILMPCPSLSCFPLDSMFSYSRKWLQMTSFNSRRMMDVGQAAEDIIEVEETDGLGLIKMHYTLRCMMEYGEYRYLVKVEDEDENSRYMCYQFTVLTQHVIRQGRTEENINRKRVDCLDDVYTEDEAVLIAYEDIRPLQCPLAGGFQLIARQGMSPDGHCQESVRTYNPYIQFHCDWRGSGSVVVDFGKECEPAVLTPSMGGRHMTHLKCVSEWEENTGFHSLLLQMRDHPQTFWCLHYKIVKSSKSGTNAADSAELLEIYLTVDGRCSSQDFGVEDVPKNTSMFGYLVAYRQATEVRCTEKVYLDSCKLNSDKCFDSIECPSYCKRCKKPLTNHNCSFPSATLGTWKVVHSDRNLEITIEKTRIKSSSLGDFLCVGPSEDALPELTFPVVQASAGQTCMPYYACAVVHIPTTGILIFQLEPSIRNQKTGEPLSCKESRDILGPVTHPEPEKAIMLINQHKLHTTSCNHRHRSTYPTNAHGCKVVVHECTGTCQTLNVTYDIPSCGNETEQEFYIEHRHVCYATLTFEDGVQGILAKTFTTGRYLCWLFTSAKLFVADPEQCNQESVTEIFSDMSAHVRYDPLSAISLQPVNNNSADKCVMGISALIVYVVILNLVLKTVFIQGVER